MNNLNSVQIDKIKKILENAEIMNDRDLESLRCNISSSDGNMKVREVILEGIDSIINKSQLTNIATVCDGDTKFDEE
jgi:transcriptional regulator of aromatic amino acid metabolism